MNTQTQTIYIYIYYLCFLICRNYEDPPITNDRLQVPSLQFSCGITGALWSNRSVPVYVTIDLDVWRRIVFEKGVTSEHCVHHLYQKDDFHKFKYLPGNWWYNLDGDGNGISVDFLLKAKPMLSWSPKNFFKGGWWNDQGKTISYWKRLSNSNKKVLYCRRNLLLNITII